MPIGYYSQKGGSAASAPNNSNYIYDNYGANLSVQLDAQTFAQNNVIDGTSLSTLTTQTGESIAPRSGGWGDGTYEKNVIGIHPAMEFGINEIIAVTPSVDLTNTDWTFGAVFKVADISVAATPVELFTESGAFNQGAIMLRQGGATFDWVTNFIFELGSGSNSVNVGADYDTALVVVTYEESTRMLTQYVNPIGQSLSSQIETLPISRTMHFQTQPELRLGSFTNSNLITTWVGEVFVLNVLLSNTEIITQLAPALNSKWS